MVLTRTLGVITIVISLYSVQVTPQILGEVQEAMRCVAKLLPCQPYIHFSLPPSPYCCNPMKEIAENDVTCLCVAFNHPDLLRFIALTKEAALNLIRSCGVNQNLSVCNGTNASSPAVLPVASANEKSASVQKNVALVLSFVSTFLGMIFF